MIDVLFFRSFFRLEGRVEIGRGQLRAGYVRPLWLQFTAAERYDKLADRGWQCPGVMTSWHG